MSVSLNIRNYNIFFYGLWLFDVFFLAEVSVINIDYVLYL
jgi:hypothetical protein